MKRHIWAIILAVGLAFFAAGVAGMVIEAVFHPTQPFWICFWVAIFGLIVSLISIFHSQIYEFYMHLKAKTLIIWKGFTHLKQSGELLILKDCQQKNPEKWLYPVIGYIDLNRQGVGHDDNDVYVSFKIDSHLLHPIKEFYVFVKLCLAPDDNYSSEAAESAWYEVTKPEKYAPIGCLERYGFSDFIVPLMGQTDDEKRLLKWMQDFREGKPLLAMLKVGINFKKDGDWLKRSGGTPRRRACPRFSVSVNVAANTAATAPGHQSFFFCILERYSLSITVRFNINAWLILLFVVVQQKQSNRGNSIDYKLCI